MASPPPAQGKRKGGAMRSPVTWIIVLAVALGGGAYLLYRRSQAQNPGTGTTGTTTGTGTGTDYSGEIATLQTEIMDLQSSESQEGDNDDHKHGKIPVEPPPLAKAGTPAHVHATGSTPNSVSIAWDKAPRATSYQVRLSGRGTQTNPHKNWVDRRDGVHGTSVTFGGLKPDTPYAVEVQAMPGGGTGSISVTTKAAPKKRRRAAPAASAHHVTRGKAA